eukprot:2794936-Pyramimonas_sp.AAC.1
MTPRPENCPGRPSRAPHMSMTQGATGWRVEPYSLNAARTLLRQLQGRQRVHKLLSAVQSPAIRGGLRQECHPQVARQEKLFPLV